MTLPTATTIAGQRRQVWEGKASRTKGGLTKKDLKENKKTGKIVSVRASAAAKSRAEPLKKWNAAVKKAAKEIGCTPVVAPEKGTKLYKLAKKMYTSTKSKKSAKYCNRSASGVKKTKSKCLSSKSCSWVKGRKASKGKSRRVGYCRKSRS